MALNIDKGANLTSDVYGINKYVNESKKKFTPGVHGGWSMFTFGSPL